MTMAKQYKAGQIVTIKTRAGNILFRITRFDTIPLAPCYDCPGLFSVRFFCHTVLPKDLRLKRILPKSSLG